jgi:hypothetical protein
LICVIGDEISVVVGRNFKGVGNNNEYHSANVSEFSKDAHLQFSSQYCRAETTRPF